MKTRKRLTREASKEVTRIRLIEVSERLFIRKGFDDASVDEISETAGYFRGACYYNFDDKGQLFLAVIGRRRPKAVDDLDEIFQQISEPAERIAAVREWFSNRWRLKNYIALRMEFSLRAMRDRNVRKHLAELWQRELEISGPDYSRRGAGRIGERQRLGRRVGNGRCGFPGQWQGGQGAVEEGQHVSKGQLGEKELAAAITEARRVSTVEAEAGTANRSCSWNGKPRCSAHRPICCGRNTTGA